MAPPRPLFTVETGTNKPVERKIGHYSLLKEYFECFKFVCSVDEKFYSAYHYILELHSDV